MNHDFFKVINNYKYLNIEVSSLAYSMLGTEWNFESCDNFNRLYFVIDGEGVLFTEDKGEVRMKPGHIYLIPAQCAYGCRCDEHLEKIFVHFKVTILPHKDLFSSVGKIVELPYPEETILKLKEELYKGSIHSTMYFKVLLESIIFEIMEPYEEKYNHELTLYKKFEDFFSYTMSHQYADVSVTDICDNIGMSPRQLAYQYKTATGQSVKAYLNELLTEKAKLLLQTTNMPVKEIAEKLRYSNEFYFSRFFKKQTGVSPREYRVRCNILS